MHSYVYIYNTYACTFPISVGSMNRGMMYILWCHMRVCTAHAASSSSLAQVLTVSPMCVSSITVLAQLLMCLKRSGPRCTPPYHRDTTTTALRTFISCMASNTCWHKWQGSTEELQLQECSKQHPAPAQHQCVVRLACTTYRHTPCLHYMLRLSKCLFVTRHNIDCDRTWRDMELTSNIRSSCGPAALSPSLSQSWMKTFLSSSNIRYAIMLCVAMATLRFSFNLKSTSFT